MKRRRKLHTQITHCALAAGEHGCRMKCAPLPYVPLLNLAVAISHHASAKCRLWRMACLPLEMATDGPRSRHFVGW